MKGVYQASRRYRRRPSALCIDDALERIARGTRAQQFLRPLSPGFDEPIPGSQARMRLAKNSAFSIRSAGASGWLSRTQITSRASSAGPIPRPIGLLPSVAKACTVNPRPRPTISNSAASSSASPSVLSLALFPNGRSTMTWVEPAVNFFDKIEATDQRFEINPQRPRDRIHHVVDHRVVKPAVPGDASARLFQAKAKLGRTQFDIRERFHRIGCAGGRGDRPRGGLRHEKATMGGDDWNDDQRNTASWECHPWNVYRRLFFPAMSFAG